MPIQIPAEILVAFKLILKFTQNSKIPRTAEENKKSRRQRYESAERRGNKGEKEVGRVYASTNIKFILKL